MKKIEAMTHSGGKKCFPDSPLLLLSNKSKLKAAVTSNVRVTIKPAVKSTDSAASIPKLALLVPNI